MIFYPTKENGYAFLYIYTLVFQIVMLLPLKQLNLMLRINDLFKRYLVEARWYNSRYQPTLEEYLGNTFVTVAGPIVALYAYIYTANPIKKEELKFIENFSDIIRLAYEIFRISDDYGTSAVQNLTSCKI